MNHAAVDILLILQIYVVAFILLHDWIPLGALNNLAGVRTVDPLSKRIVTTLLSGLPFALCLAFSLAYARSPHYPEWVMIWLWATYGISLFGAIQAWWLPYLGGADPARTARYKIRFADTHAFLPERNGIVPDTLHVTLHLVLAGVLLLLLIV